jgi:hypothetical protein
MVTCPKCGKEVEEGSYFCKFCGATLVTSSETGSITSEKGSISSEVRVIVDKRLKAIQTHDEDIIGEIMDKSMYTKFDDWPPFNRQDSTEALENEKGAYKVIRKYDYEIIDYKEDMLDGTALATFHIHYWGTIRDRDFDVNSRVTLVMKKQDQLWKVIHEHWSRFPETKQRKGFFG